MFPRTSSHEGGEGEYKRLRDTYADTFLTTSNEKLDDLKYLQVVLSKSLEGRIEEKEK